MHVLFIDLHGKNWRNYLGPKPRFPQLFNGNLCVVVVMERLMTFLVARIVF